MLACHKTVRGPCMQPYPKAAAEDLRRRVDKYLAWCFSWETPPRVKELASSLGMTREGLSAKFTRLYRISISAYFRERRIEYADRLLRAGETTTRVAYRAAFGSRRTLFRVYRRARGVTPVASRRSRSR